MPNDAEILSRVQTLVEDYHPEGHLDHLSKFLLSFSGLKHPSVRMHMARVALIAHDVADEVGYIAAKPAFFGGLFHDLGKLLLPCDLFDGHNISSKEYALVKEHAVLGFQALKDHHLYTALCAGMHHAMSKSEGDYGIRFFNEIIMTSFKPRTALRILETSLAISIADFVDAFLQRKTEIKDSTLDRDKMSLRDLLISKYEEDAVNLIDVAIREGQRYVLP